MQTVTTVGLDIAKSVFQVHCVDVADQVIIRRQLKRRYVLAFFQKLPPCLIGIEACASSHYWSRELQALGHTVRLMPAAYVKPYVKRQKNDAADAEAICEAVTRANMRFVETKTPEQQSCLMLHRTRHLLIRQQTAVINAIRAHLAEFGIVASWCRGTTRGRGRSERPTGTRGGARVSRGAWCPAARPQETDSRVRPYDQRLAPVE
jgi:transposase